MKELNVPEEPRPSGYAVKAPVFPFERFWVDPVLGPEMKSTGEVMGRGATVGEAFLKTQLNLKTKLPTEGGVFVSVSDPDQPKVVPIARRLWEMGFRLYATRGTARALEGAGLPVERVYKLEEGHPNGLDLLRSGKVHLLINTPRGKTSHRDDAHIRLAAMRQRLPYVTTLAGARALVDALEALRAGKLAVRALCECECESESERASSETPVRSAQLAEDPPHDLLG